MRMRDWSSDVCSSDLRKIWQAIAQDDAVAARAVEECLRFNPSLELATPRYAREDLDIAGTAVRKGDLLFIALGAANRDPAVFAAEIGRARVGKECVRTGISGWWPYR